MPAEELATLVAPADLAVMIGQDGTRRSAFRRDPSARTDWKRYTEVAAEMTLEVIGLCFRLGVRSVMVTVLWPPNFERSEKYVEAFLGPFGLPRLYDERHRAFYADWDARARLTGAWRQATTSVAARMEGIAASLAAATPSGSRSVYWECDAGSIMGALLAVAVRMGPDEAALRAALYPEGPDRLDLAIKCGRIRSLNRVVCPLLVDRADIYVTNNLSLDLTEAQLRAILYDHLFLRAMAPEDDMTYSDEYLARYDAWLSARPPAVVGLGELDPGGNWVPLGGVDPARFPEAGTAAGDAGDLIHLRDLVARTTIGVHPGERTRRQEVRLDVILHREIAAAGTSDRLCDTVDYAAVAGRVVEEAEDTSFQLLEALVEHLARVILAEFDVRAVRIAAFKPEALAAGLAGVEIFLARPEAA